MQDQPTYQITSKQREGVVVAIDSLRAARAEDSPVRCVSSGYLAEECSCPVTIPASVVAAAWGRERAARGCGESRFFHFAWNGEVWLGFGLADGQIRGVYCPGHRAERDARSAGCEISHLPRPARAVASV